MYAHTDTLKWGFRGMKARLGLWKKDYYKSCWWRISTPQMFLDHFKAGNITIKFTTIEPNINLKLYGGTGRDVDSETPVIENVTLDQVPLAA